MDDDDERKKKGVEEGTHMSTSRPSKISLYFKVSTTDFY